MKDLEHLERRITKTAFQKKSITFRLTHLELRFQTHNDRVGGGNERYSVNFEISGPFIKATIFDAEENKVVRILNL